jgi:hypothetical protein
MDLLAKHDLGKALELTAKVLNAYYVTMEKKPF